MTLVGVPYGGGGSRRGPQGDAADAAVLQLLEAFVFGVNALEERLHASFYFYFLLSADLFVSMGVLRVIAPSFTLPVTVALVTPVHVLASFVTGLLVGALRTVR